MWEAAAACALAVVLLFGDRLPSVDDVARTAREVSQATGLTDLGGVVAGPGEDALLVLGPLRQTLGVARDGWEVLESRAVRASEWSRRVGSALESGDAGGLLREIRAVLEPLGLYPGNDEESGSVSPDGQSAPASGSTREAEATAPEQTGREDATSAGAGAEGSPPMPAGESGEER
jgi:hypothetical protein